MILAHTEAPREFTPDEVEFLVSSASLVAGAIENARLYEETRRRVRELEGLTGLAEAIAVADTIEELLPAVARGARSLLAAASAHVYLLDTASEELHRAASDPPRAGARERIGLSELGREVRRRKRGARISVPLVAGDELLGLLVAEDSSDVELARAAANQAAVGIKKVQLIARLTEENLIKDFFEELERGQRGPELEGRAARLGLDLDRPYLVLVAEPPDDALERALGMLAPGSLIDRRERSTRALLRVPPGGVDRLLDGIRRAHAQLPTPGGGRALEPLHRACRRSPTGSQRRARLRSARPSSRARRRSSRTRTSARTSTSCASPARAVSATPPSTPSRSSPTTTGSEAPRSFQTLEEFLRRRGSISVTSEALFVHPNTLRQRLRRIADVSGLDLREDDWLMVEIAVKLVKLRGSTGPAGSDTSGRVEGGGSLRRVAPARGDRQRRTR